MKFDITPPPTCSTREAAEVLGISVRTAQLWVEEGRLQAWKTPGGHRRILRTSVDHLFEQQQLTARQGSMELSIHVLDARSERRDALQLRLQEHFPNCSLSLSANAFDGLLKIGEQTPHILIADIRLLGEDDFRIIDAVDRRPRLRNMLVIVFGDEGQVPDTVRRKLPANFSLLPPGGNADEMLRLIKAYNLGRRNPLRPA